VAVEQVTGTPAGPAGPVNSDGASFLFVGIPTTTVGTLDSHLGETGFHRPTDNLERIVMERLPEGVDILQSFINAFTRSTGDDHES
jgi:hypothetical protein